MVFKRYRQVSVGINNLLCGEALKQCTVFFKEIDIEIGVCWSMLLVYLTLGSNYTYG